MSETADPDRLLLAAALPMALVFAGLWSPPGTPPVSAFRAEGR